MSPKGASNPLYTAEEGVALHLVRDPAGQDSRSDAFKHRPKYSQGAKIQPVPGGEPARFSIVQKPVLSPSRG